ncbi:MAG: adenylosuccinate synthetase, partial [Siphonobacter aquaeclarae]|nr:adenylosuccinate synthetase [Siphonobacter aquaeclarae]
SITDLPDQLKNYIRLLESSLEVPISYVSVGPDRRQTLVNDK